MNKNINTFNEWAISDKDKAIVLVKSMHEKLKSMTNGHKQFKKIYRI